MFITWERTLHLFAYESNQSMYHLQHKLGLIKESVMYPLSYLHTNAKDLKFIMLMISSGIEWSAEQSTRSRTISGISWDNQCVRESHTSGHRKVKNSEFHLHLQSFTCHLLRPECSIFDSNCNWYYLQNLSAYVVKSLNHDKGSNIDNLTTSPIRTYPEHQFFAERGGVGQEALFNVMKAYSVHDREVYLRN